MCRSIIYFRRTSVLAGSRFLNRYNYFFVCILEADVHEESDKSNAFSTIWSYTTSDDQWTAGFLSDVFLVLNLDVKFQEVFEVKWDNAACGVIELDTDVVPPLPTRVVFDLVAPLTKSALAFYTRYHVHYVKLPDLYRSKLNIDYTVNICVCGAAGEVSVEDNEDCTCPS